MIYNGIKVEEQSQSLGTSLLSKRVQFNIIWHPGRGVNVPVKVEIKLPREKASEIRHSLEYNGINAQIMDL